MGAAEAALSEPLSYSLGRRNLILIAAVTFSVEAIGAALAPGVLVLFRIVPGLAVGAALIVPLYHEVRVETATGELRAVGRPRFFETSYSPPQPRLFALRVLGEGGRLKAMRLEGYAPRAPRRPWALQEAFSPYAEAL